MKIFAAIISLAVASVVSSSAADSTAKITGVHLCCKSCITGVEKAVETVPGTKADVDQDAGTVTLSGPDAATVQKAADALVAAGYFGKSSDSNIHLDANSGVKGEKVQSLKI